MRLFNRFCMMLVCGLYVSTTDSSILRLSFEGVVERTDLVISGRVHSGEFHVRREAAPDLFEYCVNVDTVLIGSFSEKSICFKARSSLRIGGEYIVFLREIESRSEFELSLTLMELLSFELSDDFSGDRSGMVRWEPPIHPLIPGLTEKVFSIDVIDEHNSENSRIVHVFSYFTRDEVYRLIHDSFE